MGPRTGLNILEERKIVVVPAGIRTPDRSARRLVTYRQHFPSCVYKSKSLLTVLLCVDKLRTQ